MILKVGEAKSKDAGRVIARIDPQSFKDLGVEIGDVVKLKSSSAGKKEVRETVAKIMPTYPEDRGKGMIQIDGVIRENARVGLGEKVVIEKVAGSQARAVVLAPLTSVYVPTSEEDREYIAKLLDGTPVLENDKLRITFFGSRAQDFLVEDTDPEGAVIITPNTIVKIKGQGKGKGSIGVTYEDIGGLSKELARIREMIELPLKYPEVFERLGIDAPKGVLLHGPPGCGKTLIARAVANETDAYFTSITGPEIMGKFYGESEARLREVFQDAEAHAPSILFIDEIDSIAPKREELGGEKQVERRVVAQLLALMDGLESRGQVIVIGATNIPNVLDPALRRPGRFDREIVISIPDKNGRRQILEIHTRGMPLAKDVDPERLAEITHGFVGADLAALCREAAMASLRELMPEIEFEKEYIPYKKLSELTVNMDHFREALKDVEPSALREVFTEIPDVTWEDVGGLESVKQTLKETIEWPLRYAKLFAEAGVVPPKGILLYGPPGCGKTLLAKAVASESGVNFISVKGPQLFSKYIGESERGVREVFRKARQAAPCIVFFDEIDGLVPKRTESSDSQTTERVVSQFLTEMDGMEELRGVMVLGATNRLDRIDSALLRAGRFDFLLEVPKPDEKSRSAIWEVHTKNKPLAPDVKLSEFAKLSEGFTGSDIEATAKKAAMAAIRASFQSKSKKLKITQEDFREAIRAHTVS